MAMAALVSVSVVRRGFVMQAVKIVAMLMAVIVIVAVHSRGVEMSVQGMPCRPGGLEGHEQHEKNQEYTTHGAQW